MKTIKISNILLIPIFSLAIITTLFSQNYHKKNKPMKTETATFGSGCFWCTEAIFDRIEGVIKVEPGFSGGETKNPSYNEVVSGTTGHAEVAQITFDPKKVTYQSLLEIFWKTHDPTSINRQGADVGTQYRSVIFYHDKNQEKLAERFLSELQESGIWDNPIVTEIMPLEVFYPAENYHNDYYEKNPTNSYCSFVITPKIKKFEEVFADRLKK